MRILYYDLNVPHLLKEDNVPFGGAAVDVYSFLQNFDKQIHVGLLTWKGAKKYIGDRKDINFEIVESFSKDNRIPFIDTFFIKIPSLFFAIRKWNPDIITTKCPGVMPGILALISKILGVDFVYQIANDIEVDHRMTKRLSWLSYKIFKYAQNSAKHIRCQNKYQYDELVKIYPKDKIFLIYNPFFRDQSSSKAVTKRSYIAWVGTFRNQKNIPLLYNIAKNIPEIEVRIAGKEVNYANQHTVEALRNLGELKNVKFEGFTNRNDIFKFLENSYALLNTSTHEGFPNTYLESWSVGTPVICSNFANPDNLIVKNNLGYVCTTEAEYIEKVRECVKSNKFEKITKEYVEKNHNPKIATKRFVEAVKNGS